jgi:hypothetical protein
MAQLPSTVGEVLLFGCSKLQLDFIILLGWTEDREVNRYQVWIHYKKSNNFLLLDCNKFIQNYKATVTALVNLSRCIP